MLRPPLGSVQDKRSTDAIANLERRKEVRTLYVTADFGGGATTATTQVNGLSWLTSDHVAVVALTTGAQSTAGLRGAAVDFRPGSGFTLNLTSATPLSGVQRLGIMVA